MFTLLFFVIWPCQLPKAMFEHPEHPRDLLDLAWGAKHVRESEFNFKILLKRSKLEKMRKSRKTKENEKYHQF